MVCGLTSSWSFKFYIFLCDVITRAQKSWQNVTIPLRGRDQDWSMIVYKSDLHLHCIYTYMVVLNVASKYQQVWWFEIEMRRRNSLLICHYNEVEHPTKEAFYFGYKKREKFNTKWCVKVYFKWLNVSKCDIKCSEICHYIH